MLAHPDDEIGCAALLHRVIQAGGQVTAVWAHSTPTREAESRRAFELIGPASLHFLGLPDGDILDHLPELQTALAEIVRDFAPTDIVTMHFEQGHLDHDACCYASHQLGVERVWEFPMYHTYAVRAQHLGRFSDDAGEHFMLLTPAERKLKNQLTHCYPSQTLRRNVVAYQIFMLLTLRPTSLDISERFKVGLTHDWSQPNHRPALAERVRRTPQWARWLRMLVP